MPVIVCRLASKTYTMTGQKIRILIVSETVWHRLNLNSTARTNLIKTFLLISIFNNKAGKGSVQSVVITTHHRVSIEDHVL